MLVFCIITAGIRIERLATVKTLSSVVCIVLVASCELVSDARSESRASTDRIFVTSEYFTFGAADAFTASVKLADFDRDGDLDGFAVNGRHWARQDFLFFNNGFGRFLTAKAVGNITTGYEPAIFDLNRDGIDDIVIARDRVQSEIFFGKGNGNFTDPVAFGNAGPARSVLVADANADRHVDLIVSQRSEKNYIALCVIV